jgi:Cu/Zn superoxide dismutase
MCTRVWKVAALIMSLTALTSAMTTSAVAGSGVEYHAALDAVPHDPTADLGSNVTGSADLTRVDGTLHVEIHATGLTPNIPHLMHIHGVLKARNECPPSSADTNGDGLISIGEGLPFYGPVNVSLTTSGDTSAASGGDLSRMVIADANGEINYDRSFRIPRDVAAKLGKLAIVVHGLDGLDSAAGYSSPMEVTIPVACGAIVQAGQPA